MEPRVDQSSYETSWGRPKAKTPPFVKGGPGGISSKPLKIPLNPPFRKGDFHDPTGMWFMKFLSLIRLAPGQRPRLYINRKPLKLLLSIFDYKNLYLNFRFLHVQRERMSLRMPRSIG